MNTIPENPPQKQCSKCNQFFPATTEFFHRHKTSKDGLRPHCKACRRIDAQKPEAREKRKAYRNRPEVHAKEEAYRQIYRSKPETQEHERSYRQSYYSKPEVQKHLRSWYSTYNHRPDIQERKRAYNHAYRSQPENQERIRNHNKRPENQARRQAWEKAHFSHPEVQEKYRQRRKIYHNRPDVRQRYRLHVRNRRVLRMATPGTLTPQQIQDKLKAQKYTCYYCFDKFEKIDGQYVYHLEHTIPLSRTEAGPRHDINFVVLSCPTCNLKKGNKLPHEFPEGGRLL